LSEAVVKFVLLDRIVVLEPAKRIVARKALSLAEEYLADHFPTFPVMPGVLMVEAMTEAAGWLLQASHDFAYSLLELAEVRNVTYKNFVRPGEVLEIEVTVRKAEPGCTEFDGIGRCNGLEMVRGRLSLRHGRVSTDAMHDRIVTDARARFGLLARDLSAGALPAGAAPGGSGPISQ
jgi:3-hydroxyacyl-[acyl-carrier-protein] dehydratase